MNDKLIKSFFQDIKKIFTIEKLKEYLKLPVYAYVISFIIGVLISVIYTLSNPESINKVSAITRSELGFVTFPTWSYIIQNNLKVLFTLFISGIILYIGPLLGLGINGSLHGIFLGAAVMGKGITGLVAYLLLMGPHGIFELPALLFGTGSGIALSRIILEARYFKFFDKSKLYEAFLLILIAVCLFFIASVIEVQITFKLLDIFKSRFPMDGG